MPNDLVESFSGIRGIYGQGITEDKAYLYGLTYCRIFKKKGGVLVISGDSRPSTPVLKKAMIKAFQTAGVKKIIDIGIAPVQVCQYAVNKFKAQGGAYISASHNEPEYNGWKLLKKDGALIYTKDSDKLIAAVHRSERVEKWISGQVETVIVDKHKESIDNYINYVLKRLGKKAVMRIKEMKPRILLDPNGGAAITVLNKICQKLGVKAEIVNGRLGVFNRLVEPNVKSLAYLEDKIKKGNFAFAAGFDADADRMEIVINPESRFAKEMGSAISGQYVLALACDAMLAGTKGQIITTNDATSYLVRDAIKKHKATMREVEVGEMPVVEGMEKNKSIIGGEGSNGGVIIPPIKCRDGIMTIALIIKLMAQNKKSLEEILDSYPRYYEAIAKINCSPEKSLGIKSEAEKYFRARGYKIKKTGDKDGGLKALIDTENFVWFRQSRTEPGAFRIFAEGNNKQKVEKLLTEGVKVFYGNPENQSQKPE